MTYFQLVISTLTLGNENCVTWETRTATSTKDFHLFLVPVCVVCKSVILSCLTINHVWNLGCACGVEWLAFASSSSGSFWRTAWEAKGLLSLPRSILGNPWHCHHWSFALLTWNEVDHLLDTLQIFNTSLCFRSSHHGDLKGDPSRWSHDCNFLE